MKKLLLILSLALFMASCTSEPYDPIPEQDPTVDRVVGFKDSDVVQGKIVFKFTPDVAAGMETRSHTDRSVLTGFTMIDEISARIGAVEMKPLFNNLGGKFEKRQREAGLHLWYEMTFDESIPVTKAVPQFSDIEGIEVVEPMPILEVPDTQFIVTEQNMDVTTRAYLPFNDPRLGEQWHYNNDGIVVSGSIVGADINAFAAWETQTGSPDVIVAVLDMGVDGTHEDLAQNMWNDGNGHFGYNFENNSYNVPKGTHGTHVAGTIAAVNNNGKGVGGVAGGNGSPTSGVRIMSCHIGSYAPIASAAINAFQWAADNGAVIAQCSWTAGDSQALKDAIRYFVVNAGLDEYGIQSGPMRGGLVVVAAGNDNMEIGRIPAAYPNVMSVASMGPAFAKASYSNWHTTVDVTAPGGDMISPYGTPGGVLSTLPNNTYGMNQGTSMAAPHVSGVAALVISEFAGNTLTADRVREILMGTCNNQEFYSYNQTRLGKFGAGLVDAGRAVLGYGGGNFDPDAISISGPQSTSAGRTEAYSLLNLPAGYVQSIQWSVAPHPSSGSILAFANITGGQGTPAVTVNFPRQEIVDLKAMVAFTSGLIRTYTVTVNCRIGMVPDDVILEYRHRELDLIPRPTRPIPYTTIFGDSWLPGHSGVATVTFNPEVESFITDVQWSFGNAIQMARKISSTEIEFMVSSYRFMISPATYDISCTVSYSTAPGIIETITKTVDVNTWSMGRMTPYLVLSRVVVPNTTISVSIANAQSLVNYQWHIIESPDPRFDFDNILYPNNTTRGFTVSTGGWYTILVTEPAIIQPSPRTIPPTLISFYVDPRITPIII